MVNNQNELFNLLPAELKDIETFILPLKRYLHKCPVCGHRTLQNRAMYDICEECGWEDDGMDDEDVKDCIPALKNELGLIFSGPNGDYTIKEYRAEYLKLKADNPDYTWCGQFNQK